MNNLPKIQIERSVGHQARNNIADVRIVQTQLNLLLDDSRSPLIADGIYGANTKTVMGDFQSKVLGYQHPDHRVDPNAKTIKALNDPASKKKWKHAPGTPRPVDPAKPRPVEPSRPDPQDPISPERMPKISVHGPIDQKGGFDPYPPPAQVLGPAEVNITVLRDGAWIMVPKGGERTLRLGISPDAPVQLLNNGVDENGVVRSFKREELLKVTVSGQNLTIKGLNACKNCELDIVQNGRHLKLYVSVKPLRVVPMFVFHVEHGPGMNSRVSAEELRTVLKIANSEIFRPQCNIELDLKDARQLSHEEIGKHLGVNVRRDRFDEKKDEWKLLRPFMNSRQFAQPNGAEPVKTVNLFIVRNMNAAEGKGKLPASLMGAMESNSGMCLIDDQSFGPFTAVKRVAETLCHEVGHMLIGDIYTHGHGIQSHSHNPFRDALMFAAGRGRKIYRIEIEAMNPTRHQPPPLAI